MKLLMMACALAALPPTAGCTAGRSPSGMLRAESLSGDRVVLVGRYVTAVYADHQSTETSFFLSDVPLAQILSGEVSEGHVVHLDLLWVPQPGTTPMDSQATNASIRYIVIAGDEVGIYGGAGFAVPHGQIGQNSLSISLRDASLTLIDSTDGFHDLLSPARLSGSFTATLDVQQTRQIHHAVSQIVSNALGRTRFVRASQQTGGPGRFTSASWEALSWASAWLPTDL